MPPLPCRGDPLPHVPPDTNAGESQDGLRGKRLDSWKEIAAYLNRDVATVRRWEKRERLPVHRHHHQKLGSLYAFTSELDAWSDRRQQIEQQPADPRADALPAPKRRPSFRRLAPVVTSVALVAAAAGYVWKDAQPKLQTVSSSPSLAVLPFQPLGNGARDEALELGMTDALITRLGSVGQMRVRPMSAVLKYAQARPDLEVVGRDLRVDVVLEGKFQRVSDRIRVTVQLLRVRDGVSLWAAPFDEQFTDILAVQDAISQQVARALALTLNQDERKQLSRRETHNADAYELYARGRHFLTAGVGESVRKAVDCFEQAIALDPSYAAAYASLSSAYAALANSTIVPSKDAYLDARRAALRALELDASLAEAHSTIGAVSLLYDWNWVDAEHAFRRALDREPDAAGVLRRYAIGLMWLGRFDEAKTLMQRARDLAPVDLEISANLALVLYYARHYDAAIAAAENTLEMDPRFSQAHRTIARSLVEKRLYEEAITAYRQAIAAGGVQLLTAELGHAYAISGRRTEALKIRDELRDVATKRYVSPYDMAILHVGLGEYDQAFTWLEKSYAERERWMVTLKVAPALDPLRSDRRFADLMRRVGLWN